MATIPCTGRPDDSLSTGRNGRTVTVDSKGKGHPPQGCPAGSSALCPGICMMSHAEKESPPCCPPLRICSLAVPSR